MTDFIRKWDKKRLEDSGCVVSKEFKKFQGAFNREVKRIAEEHGATLVNYRNGHYDMSGFLERNGVYLYFSYGALDRTKVQLASHSDFLSPFYMRIAKDTKNFLGGRNNNVLFSQFPETMEKLFKQDHPKQPVIHCTHPIEVYPLRYAGLLFLFFNFRQQKLAA